jgi:flagellar biosynthesis component FlhA
MSLGEAAAKFTLLSIGDGLVSQIPALIVSVGAGILVTRAAGTGNLGHQIGGQIVKYPRAIGISGGMLGVFALMPGMPTLPFLVLALVRPVMLPGCSSSSRRSMRPGGNCRRHRQGRDRQVRGRRRGQGRRRRAGKWAGRDFRGHSQTHRPRRVRD